MSILHVDNFSLFGGNIGLLTQGIYAEVSGANALVADPDGISPGYVLRQQSSAAAQPTVRYVLPGERTKVGVCFRIWMNNLPTYSQDRPRMSFRNAGNGEVAYVIVETTGQLTWVGGAVGSVTSAAPAITAGGWWHIEILFDTVAQIFEVRVEGVTVIPQTAIGSNIGNIAQLAFYYFGNNFGGTFVWYKDFVVYDGLGTVNNTFLGTVLVVTLLPDADVNLNWTPVGAANGFSILDNVPPDDTKHLDAPFPAPAAYQGSLSNLPANVTSVKAVMTFVRAAKSDAGDANLQVSLISDPTGVPATGDGTDRPMTVTQTYWRDVFELDPKTAAAWTPAAVDAVNLKLNRTL